MSAFRRTLRLLHEDGMRPWKWTFVSIAGFLLAWSIWFALARVKIYETSDSARIELDGAVYAIDAPVSGRVASSALSLGRRVQAGETLVTLDAEQFILEQRELIARRSGLLIEIAALQREIEVQRIAIGSADSLSELVRAESSARWDEARASAKLAAEEAARVAKLHEAGLTGDMELMRARSEAERKQAAAESLKWSVSRQQADENLRGSERGARLDVLNRELAALESQSRSLAVAIERAGHEIEQRRIRASASGVVAEASELKAGAVIEEGDRIASIVSDGKLRVVASFPPASVGRLRRGQTAWLRLDGYPWQQYGSVPLVVERVAGEARDAQIRVELRLAAKPPAIPLQHALPGAVEVAVENISPAAFVLRSVGHRVKSSS